MLDWVSQIQHFLKDGIAVILITVLKTRGSTPCGRGHKMLCSLSSTEDKELHLWGSIGGGLIEHQVCQYAKELLEQPQDKSRTYTIDCQSYQLHPDSGQCCGGEIQLCFERINPHFPHIEWMANLSSFYHHQQDALLLSVHTANFTIKQAYGMQSLPVMQSQIDTILSHLSPVVADKLRTQVQQVMNIEAINFLQYSDKAITMIIEKVEYSRIQPVVLFGCGHISRALVSIISQLPVKIYWVDDRSQEFARCMQQYIDKPIPSNVHILCQDFLSVDIPVNAYCLVITYSHQRDYDICKHILSNAKPCYLGLIGSTVKEKRFRHFLQQEENIAMDVVDTLHCPIGEVYKTQKSPMAIAIAIANHLLKTVNQRYERPSTTA